MKSLAAFVYFSVLLLLIAAPSLHAEDQVIMEGDVIRIIGDGSGNAPGPDEAQVTEAKQDSRQAYERRESIRKQIESEKRVARKNRSYLDREDRKALR